jgi:hypothetical protein
VPWAGVFSENTVRIRLRERNRTDRVLARAANGAKVKVVSKRQQGVLVGQNPNLCA